MTNIDPNSVFIPSVLKVSASEDLNTEHDLQQQPSKSIAELLEDTNTDEKKQ